MTISISERLRPFTHTPGTALILPKTTLAFRIYPTRFYVEDYSFPKPRRAQIVDFELEGPPKDFTVQLDLERGMIVVYGHFKEGFVRYKIVRGDEGYLLTIDKCHEKGIKSQSLDRILYQKECYSILQEGIVLSQPAPHSALIRERLSLGSHKLQDFDQIRRRASLMEILPLWHALGKNLPEMPQVERAGNLLLLSSIERSLIEKEKVRITRQFLDLFMAGFKGILSPRLEDEDYLGIKSSILSQELSGSPLLLLTEGAKLISRLFIETTQESIAILPLLPPEFHSGRMLNAAALGFGDVDLEWSKKTIRRMIFKSATTGPVPFIFQKGITSFRVRKSMKENGKQVAVNVPFNAISETRYYFDNFQK